MHAPRVSIAGLMGVVAVVAVGAFGVKEGSAPWAGATCMLTLALLVASTLAAGFGRRRDRPAWAGFALTGWVFLLASMNPWGGSAVPMPPMPTEGLISALNDRIHPLPQYVPNPNMRPGITFPTYSPLQPPMIIKPGSPVWRGELLHVRQSAHALLALLFATVGGLASRYAFGPGDRGGVRETSVKDAPPGSDPRDGPLP